MCVCIGAFLAAEDGGSYHEEKKWCKLKVVNMKWKVQELCRESRDDFSFQQSMLRGRDQIVDEQVQPVHSSTNNNCTSYHVSFGQCYLLPADESGTVLGAHSWARQCRQDHSPRGIEGALLEQLHQATSGPYHTHGGTKRGYPSGGWYASQVLGRGWTGCFERAMERVLRTGTRHCLCCRLLRSRETTGVSGHALGNLHRRPRGRNARAHASKQAGLGRAWQVRPCTDQGRVQQDRRVDERQRLPRAPRLRPHR